MRRGVNASGGRAHPRNQFAVVGEPAPVREAVGVAPTVDAGPDRDSPTRTQAPISGVSDPKGHRRPARGLALRQAVDESPEPRIGSAKAMIASATLASAGRRHPQVEPLAGARM